jgi:hypothetical protein
LQEAGRLKAVKLSRRPLGNVYFRAAEVHQLVANADAD